ncbi:MAG: S41 family peptidase [Vulcanimicrobiaceae bacterium]
MPQPLRALAVVLAIALASLGGAIYLARERVQGPALVADSGRPALVDLATLLRDPRAADERLVDDAFTQVEETYYKTVDPSVMLGGERRELLAVIRRHGIVHPALPVFSATGNEDRDLTALNADLAAAQRRYGTSISHIELTEAAISGMLASLGDPYTTYLSPSEIDSLRESLSGGDFGGIGVLIQTDTAGRLIVEPFKGTPAQRSGVRFGDRVVAVDGRPIAGLSIDSVERLIRGPIGSMVRLDLVSPGAGDTHTVSIVRARIQVPTVASRMEGRFEYIALGEFGSTSFDEVRRALLAGKAAGARGYIFDLRDNGGGLVDAAVQISSLFIPNGPIVSTVDRFGKRKVDEATGNYLGARPLVVLVNRYTASASEITAGAIQDDKVGTLIGERTFGKGVVQSIYGLSDGGALKITTDRYETPLGRDIQHRGIEPDIVVDQPADKPIIDTPKDLQLNAAKALLRQLAQR